MQHQHHDAVIVGTRAAGAATALVPALAGAKLALGTRHETCLQARDGRVVAVSVRARGGTRRMPSADLLVGADGRMARVAASPGARTPVASPAATGLRCRRFPGAPGVLRDRSRPGRALVGDAGCYRDPVTTPGLTDARLDALRALHERPRAASASLPPFPAPGPHRAVALAALP